MLDIDEDGYCVLISKYALGTMPYNKEKNAETTWENCSLRAWLNDDFYNTAFSSEEQAEIKLTHLINAGNSAYGMTGGAETDDRIYLLSLDEITRYYDIEPKNYYVIRQETCSLPTARAASEGAFVLESDDPRDTKYNGCCVWWLRSPGSKNSYASYVDVHGCVFDVGWSAHCPNYTVRPVIRAALLVNNNGTSHYQEEADEIHEDGSADAVITYNGLVIDADKQQVIYKDSELELEPQYVALLYYLASNPGQVFSDDELYYSVTINYGSKDSRGVMLAIKRLREAFADCGELGWSIKTVWGKGYKFDVQ